MLNVLHCCRRMDDDFVDRPELIQSMVMMALFSLGAIFMSGAALAATFDCVLDPALSLQLGSPVTSIIDTVEVDRGDIVTQGQIVARLESAVETAAVALDRAKAESTAEITARQVRVELTRLAYGRQTTLQERNVAARRRKSTRSRADYQTAQQELALAQLNHHVAELELQRARATLEQRIIRSPIDGVVVERKLGPGEYVHQEAHILTVVKIDPLHVETFLPIRYYGQIHVGDVANVRPNDPIGGDRPARVSIVDKVFDAASGHLRYPPRLGQSRSFGASGTALSGDLHGLRRTGPPRPSRPSDSIAEPLR
ncbi:MAG: efflux RND transporter periplasmic adaptor subunit [Pseudomonadota bacterium]